MGPDMNQMNSMNIVEKTTLRGRQSLHTLPNKIELLKESNDHEIPHAMLHGLGLPKFLWGEDANIIVYVQNRCPHQALNFKTLEEVFIGKNLDGF